MIKLRILKNPISTNTLEKMAAHEALHANIREVLSPEEVYIQLSMQDTQALHKWSYAIIGIQELRKTVKNCFASVYIHLNTTPKQIPLK